MSVLSVVEELIFDRTEADVNEAEAMNRAGIQGMTEEQLAKFTGANRRISGLDGEWNALDGPLYCLGSYPKGVYNDEDINRLWRMVRYLADKQPELEIVWLAEYDPYPWSSEDYFQSSPEAELLEMLKLVTHSTGYDAMIPESLSDMDYQQANSLERALYLAARALEE